MIEFLLEFIVIGFDVLLEILEIIPKMIENVFYFFNLYF